MLAASTDRRGFRRTPAGGSGRPSGRPRASGASESVGKDSGHEEAPFWRLASTQQRYIDRCSGGNGRISEIIQAGVSRGKIGSPSGKSFDFESTLISTMSCQVRVRHSSAAMGGKTPMTAREIRFDL